MGEKYSTRLSSPLPPQGPYGFKGKLVRIEKFSLRDRIVTYDNRLNYTQGDDGR